MTGCTEIASVNFINREMLNQTNRNDQIMRMEDLKQLYSNLREKGDLWDQSSSYIGETIRKLRQCEDCQPQHKQLLFQHYEENLKYSDSLSSFVRKLKSIKARIERQERYDRLGGSQMECQQIKRDLHIMNEQVKAVVVRLREIASDIADIIDGSSNTPSRLKRERFAISEIRERINRLRTALPTTDKFETKCKSFSPNPIPKALLKRQPKHNHNKGMKALFQLQTDIYVYLKHRMASNEQQSIDVEHKCAENHSRMEHKHAELLNTVTTLQRRYEHGQNSQQPKEKETQFCVKKEKQDRRGCDDLASSIDEIKSDVASLQNLLANATETSVVRKQNAHPTNVNSVGALGSPFDAVLSQMRSVQQFIENIPQNKADFSPVTRNWMSQKVLDEFKSQKLLVTDIENLLGHLTAQQAQQGYGTSSPTVDEEQERVSQPTHSLKILVGKVNN